MALISIGALVIYLIILVPVYIFIAVSLIGKPRQPKTAIIFLGFPLTIIIAAIIGMWLMSAVFKLIVP